MFILIVLAVLVFVFVRYRSQLADFMRLGGDSAEVLDRMERGALSVSALGDRTIACVFLIFLLLLLLN